MMDWLQGNVGLYVNLKEFLSWFVKDDVFDVILKIVFRLIN
jgi:hypothetical protein